MTKSYRQARSGSSAKSNQKISGDAQGDLFGTCDISAPLVDSPNAPNLGVWPELLGAIHQSLREDRDRGIGRERVVDRMNSALPEEPRRLTKRQLDCWTAARREDRPFPLEYLPAFCWATNSDIALRALAAALGYDLVDRRESVIRRIGETHIELGRLRNEQRVLTRRLRD